MNTPYAVIPVSIIVLLAYLMTLLAARLGMISTAGHRKFWNSLLLLTFTVTAVLGLLLALQVNYKLDMIPSDKIIVWHVDFGIGMAFIAIFHLTWHFDYYVRIIRGSGKQKPDEKKFPAHHGRPPESGSMRLHSGYIPLVVVGFTALVTQIILIREFLAVFYGNELVIGIIFAVWMVLTGAGAYLGQHATTQSGKKQFAVYALYLLTLLPVVSVFMLYLLRNIVFEPGSMVNIFNILISTLILFAPFCLLSGYLFTHLSVRISESHNVNLTGESYAAESIGSIIGGLLVSLILVYFFNSFQILALLIVVNFFIVSVASGLRKTKRHSIIAMAFSLVVAAVIVIFDFDTISQSMLFPGQKLVYHRDTPFGSLSVTRHGEQINYYENNNLMFSSNDPAAAEEDVHYAMVQHDHPEKVLLISGGISGTLEEVLKHPVTAVDYVEVNPWIIQMGKESAGIPDDDRIRLIPTDARLFLNRSEELYDVILINVPAPETAHLNRFYTTDFFKELRSHAEEGAVICLSLPAFENYINEEQSLLYSIIYRTLAQHFSHLLFVPGQKTYLLASDEKMSIDIPLLIEKKGIETVFVNSWYLDAASLRMRSDLLHGQINEDAGINSDLKPLGYFQNLKLWLSHFDLNYWLITGLALLLLLVLIMRGNILSFGMLAGGFTATSIELIIILVFQAFFGYVYQFTGIIITFFMTGLVLGVLIFRKLFSGSGINGYVRLQLATGLFACSLPLFLMLLNRLKQADVSYAIYIFLVLFIAMLTGMIFTSASNLMRARIARIPAVLYSYDLAGSAFGALLISVFMIPLLGIFLSAVLAGGLNLIAAILAYAKRSRYID